jgi:GGDEF domain-containing protein
MSRLRHNLSAFNSNDTRPYRLALSYGIARYNPKQPLTLDALIQVADEAMYLQKRQNKIEPPPPVNKVTGKSKMARVL